MERRARCKENRKGEVGKAKHEEYDNKKARRRTQEQTFLLSELLSLTQQNLKSL